MVKTALPMQGCGHSIPGQACVHHSNYWKKTKPVNKSFKMSQSLMLVSGLILPTSFLFLRTHFPISLEYFCSSDTFVLLAEQLEEWEISSAMVLLSWYYNSVQLH